MGILQNAWLFAGEDATSNSDTQQPTPPWPSGQGDENPSVTRADGWSSDGTACSSAWMEVEEEGAPIGDAVHITIDTG